MSNLDVYCDRKLVGTLAEETRHAIFTYLPDTPASHVVSLLMPVRSSSYSWPGGIMPSFQKLLPEGFERRLIRQKLRSQVDGNDFELIVQAGGSTIGRVRAIPHGAELDTATAEFDVTTLLKSSNSREYLLSCIETTVFARTSKAVTETPTSLDDTATMWADDFLLKTGPLELPGLGINELLCLEVARNSDLEVPETRLSEDGQVLAIRRFDLNADGTRLGVEDFCALKGHDRNRKHQGTVEDLAKICNLHLGVEHRKDSKRRLFTLLLLNYALRNADAHLQSYALTYRSLLDARLCPASGIVTSTAYAYHQDATPALPLRGRKVWRSGKALFQYGATQLSLSPTDMNAALERVVSAVRKVLPEIDEYASRYPQFREVGKRMQAVWAQGVQDINPTAQP